MGTIARMSLLLILMTGSASASMSLTSADISPGTAIPVAHIYPRCGGANISPQLSWSGAPSATKSFVLTMIDVDVKPDEWSHWVVVDLPANLSALPRGTLSLPGGAKAVVSNFGDAAYAGPCPPKGTGVHHYQFTIWALPTATISLAPDEKATKLTALLSKQALDRASLTGMVSAPILPFASGATADTPSYGPELQGFAYPYPVVQFDFPSQRQTLHMAYMDVPAKNSNGRTVVLLHGKNFCAATWEGTIDALAASGYRVIAPDQVGFCKSSKPQRYQYSFQQLARNTRALLVSLRIRSATLIAHSTGGMIAVRYALMYPTETTQLVLVDPIGLEDWKAKGVPAISVDDWYARELKTNADSIRSYEQGTYYADHWSADYETWVQMLAGLNNGPGKELVAWNSALIYDMIYTQPVFYEFSKIAVPTLLMIGDKDNTAIGKDLAPPEIRKTLGNYPELAQRAAELIPGAKLVEFPDLGHAPQIQDPAAFHKALIEGLAK